MIVALLETIFGFMGGLLVGVMLEKQAADRELDRYRKAVIDEYPPAVCPVCGSGAAVRIPASRVGALYDFVVCYGCGKVSLVGAEDD